MNLKRKRLLYGVVCDLFGMVSIIFPPFDLIWAPLSAYLILKMYKGKKGKVAAVVSFIEEALPWIDIVPTFTLMWIYTYYLDVEKSRE